MNLKKVLLINSPIFDKKFLIKKTICLLMDASAFQFRPYHGTELYNKINQKITYSHNDRLGWYRGKKSI